MSSSETFSGSQQSAIYDVPSLQCANSLSFRAATCMLWLLVTVNKEFGYDVNSLLVNLKRKKQSILLRLIARDVSRSIDPSYH